MSPWNSQPAFLYAIVELHKALIRLQHAQLLNKVSRATKQIQSMKAKK